ncbi:MAG: peptide-methionine (S)-S-oxide reductase [Deltaproteobacteria bacterium]|nr:peptide-methionine (S)-S-oxide reductase [Deltaproteobacteria bacterium]
MIRTRVGYAGGQKTGPTYHSLGDHMESIQIDYDPRRITYQELVDHFWSWHNPYGRPWSRQYASAILYTDQEQKEQALASRDRLENSSGRKVATEIAALGKFYPAEDYHQKYTLRHSATFLAAFRWLYPDDTDQALLNSTVAARLNGYLAGDGSLKQLAQELPRLGLDRPEQEELWEILSRKRPGEKVACPLPSQP